MTIASVSDPAAGRQVAPVTPPVARSAVVWINGRRASIATVDADGRQSTCEIERGLEPELSYMASVVRAIGDRERVVVLGPGSRRLALEREYVSLYRRPDRLVDVEPARGMDRLELLGRLRELAD